MQKDFGIEEDTETGEILNIPPTGTGLIGTGYWGSILQRYLENDSRFELLHSANSSYPKELIWGDPRLNLVVIATQNDSHAELTKLALEHGKNVLVEKPLALTEKEALEIKLLSQSVGKHVITEYTQTFSPALNFVLNGGANIGQIEGYEMRVGHAGRFYPEEWRNVYWLLSSHLLSILDMYEQLDNFNFEAHTFMRKNDIPTTGALVFEKGVLRVSLNHPVKEYSAVFYGSLGTAYYSTTQSPSLKAVYYTRDTAMLAKDLIRGETAWDFNESNNLQFVLDYTCDVLRGKVGSNIDRAIRITKVLEKL